MRAAVPHPGLAGPAAPGRPRTTQRAHTHPATAQLFLGRLPFGRNGLQLADHIIGALRDNGFTDQLAAYGYNVLLNYVVGFASQETAFGKGTGGRQRLNQVQQFLKDLPQEEYPDLTAVAVVLTEGRFTDRFELGLTGIIEVLDKQLSALA